MSLFKKLFGSGDAEKPTEAEADSYKGFKITPTPVREGNAYRVSARIEKEIEGTQHTHKLVRADTIGDLDQANETSVAKSKQMIDEQGDRIFR